MEIHERRTEVPDLHCQGYLLDVLAAQLESVRLEQLNDAGSSSGRRRRDIEAVSRPRNAGWTRGGNDAEPEIACCVRAWAGP